MILHEIAVDATENNVKRVCYVWIKCNVYYLLCATYDVLCYYIVYGTLTIHVPPDTITGPGVVCLELVHEEIVLLLVIEA